MCCSVAPCAYQGSGPSPIVHSCQPATASSPFPSCLQKKEKKACSKVSKKQAGSKSSKKKAGAAGGTRGKKAAAKAKYARGPTQREFQVVMKHFLKEAEKKAHQHVLEHPNSPLEQGFIWSYDNPRIHDADLSELGITEDNRAPLPPRSGDMHKVIEHVHARLCRAMGEWVARNPNVTSRPAMMRKFQDMFFDVITPASVSADVASLPELWRWIKDNGGDGAPARLR